MTDQYQIRSTTKKAVMDNLKDVELIIPSSGYSRVVILRYQKGTERVLKETLTPYKSKDPDQPNLMQLMAAGNNELKSITTASSTDAEAVLDERDEEIKKMKKYKEDHPDKVVKIPRVLDAATADIIAETRNSANQSAMGAKDGVCQDMINKAGKETFTNILFDTDGNKLSLDDIDLHNVFQELLNGADGKLYKVQRQEMTDVLASFRIDFRLKIVKNYENLQAMVKRLEEQGIYTHVTQKAVVMLAEVEKVLGKDFAFAFNAPVQTIKQLYPSSHKHDEASLARIVEELAKADKNRDLSEAPEPEESANAVLSDLTYTDADIQDIISQAKEMGREEGYKEATEELEQANAVAAERGRNTSRDTDTPCRRSRSKSRSRNISEEQKKKNCDCPHCKKVGVEAGKHPYTSPDKCFYNPNFDGPRPSWATATILKSFRE